MGDVHVVQMYNAEPEINELGEMEDFGDIRDRLVTMPENPWNGYGGSYVISDLFPVRHKILLEQARHARSIFEIGSLYGHCLATMLDACEEVTRCGWVDNETHSPGSNLGCERNLQGFLKQSGRLVSMWHSTRARDAIGMKADVVSVDGEHSLHACIADITLALTMEPILIFVDDYDAIGDVKIAADAMADYHGLTLTHHATVNGLAVLTP